MAKKENSILPLAIGVGILLAIKAKAQDTPGDFTQVVNTDPSANTGTWIVPCNFPINNNNPFNCPAYPSNCPHNGIDILAPDGSPVVSPRPGTVQKVYTSDAGGQQIIILHDTGNATGYAHLSKTLVKEGDTLTQGQLIAYTGNTGTESTGPHLHFVLTDNKYVPISPIGIIYPAA